MGLEMAVGRNFRSEGPPDSTQLILNEAAVRALGLEDPVGSVVYTRDPLGTYYTSPVQPQPHVIVGVVKDYHYNSFHTAIQPLVFARVPWGHWMLIRFTPGNPRASVAAVKEIWRGLNPDVPFDYTWVDEAFESAYRKEEQFSVLATAFSGIAVLIACLGIIGLSAFMAVRRRKEIGIRKVLGANTRHILALLSKEFPFLVGIAFVVAAPVAYFGVHRWLDNFAYRIEITPAYFVLAGLLALLLALASVSYHALKAALANPADVLRYE